MTTTRDVRWAIVGGSEFSLVWVLPALRAAAGARPVAIVSRTPDVVRQKVDSDIVVTSQLDDLRRLDVDIVHVVTPNDSHRAIALHAIELGFDVLIEKPVATSLKQAQEMASQAMSQHRLLAVGSCMAWSPPVRAIKRLVRDGDHGEFRSAVLTVGFDARAHWGWRQTAPFSAGGGVLFDLGPHALDALVRTFGPIVEVFALMQTQLPDLQADDTTTLLLRHHSGFQSSVHLSFTHSSNNFLVTGDRGELVSREWLGRRFTGDLTWYDADGGAATFDKATVRGQAIPLTTTDILQCQAEEVSTAVLSRTRPAHAAVDDGLHVMAVIEACARSNATGRLETVADGAG